MYLRILSNIFFAFLCLSLWSNAGCDIGSHESAAEQESQEQENSPPKDNQPLPPEHNPSGGPRDNVPLPQRDDAQPPRDRSPPGTGDKPQPRPRDDAPPDQVLKGNFKWGTFAGVDLDKPATLGQKNFGAVGKAEGSVPAEIAKLGIGFKYYKKRSIKGDGSCWIRALMQTALYPILHIDADYNNFVQKIKAIPSVLVTLSQTDRDRLQMLQQEPVEFAVKLLAKLKAANEAQRHELYNYEKIDLFLDWFFRSAIAMQHLKVAAVAAAEETLTHRSFSGDHDSWESFTKYFQTTTCAVSTKAGQNKVIRCYDKDNHVEFAHYFGFFPESAYTHLVSLTGTGHAEVIERTTSYRPNRPVFYPGKDCSGLKYLLDDGEVSEIDTYEDLEAADKSAGFLHLATRVCAGDSLESALAGKAGIVAKVINKRDSQGNTPLHYGARTIANGSVHVLLKNGADPNILNDGGQLPLDMINFFIPFMKDVPTERSIELIKKTKMDTPMKDGYKTRIVDGYSLALRSNPRRFKATAAIETTKDDLLKAVEEAPLR